MLEVDVRDDGDLGLERVERTVEFVRLDDDDAAMPEPEVRAAATETAAGDGPWPFEAAGACGEATKSLMSSCLVPRISALRGGRGTPCGGMANDRVG